MAKHRDVARAKPSSVVDTQRVDWLDGVRGCAAMYVLLHHVWLAVYPTFPRDSGPFLLGWLLYGHLGVVVFIVVSGYSLTLRPSQTGYRLKGGKLDFARRRAWRILPPYWAALILSTFVADLLLTQKGGDHIGVKSILVHALLLQDVVGSPSMNGAFWSIAVEAQIYVLFPLLLWWARHRGGTFSTAGVVTAVVVVAYLLAEHVSGFAKINDLTPQLLVGFAFGMAVAGRQSAPRVGRWTVPMLPTALIAIGATMAVFALVGSERVVAQFFWVDLGVAMIAAWSFWGLAATPTSPVRAVLQSRPMDWLGQFSYSIYLVHAPLVFVAFLFIVKPIGLSAGLSFTVMTLVFVPIILATARLFFLLFERPFLSIRTFDALRIYMKPVGRRKIISAGGQGARQRPATYAPAVDSMGSTDALPLN